MKIVCGSLIAIFLAVICLPVIQMSFSFYREYDDVENRELAPLPKLKWEAVGQLPVQCDAYVSDHFGLRPDLIRWNSILRVGLLGVSPISSVIVGKDNWLFYCSEALDDGNSINDYRGTIPLSEKELVKMRHRLEEDRNELAAASIVYLVVVVPNKNTIYGEYLPDGIKKYRPLTRLDQFMAYMRAHSDVNVLDLREIMLQAKMDYPVYWKTDSHWSSYGAYVGYCEIVRRLAGALPALKPFSVSDGRVEVHRSLPGGDLAQMLFMRDRLPEDNDTKFELAQIPETPPLDTVIFRHDSFGDALYPLLSRHFKKILNIAPFAPYRFDEIAGKRPDVVLHVFAERYILQAVHGDFYYREEP